jgi:hypothetical protein
VEKEVKQSSVQQAVTTGCHHNSSRKIQSSGMKQPKQFAKECTKLLEIIHGEPVFHQNTLKSCS